MRKEQTKYEGFILKNRQNKVGWFSGISGNGGTVIYVDGSMMDIFYTKEWYPNIYETYERLPGAKFLPLKFYYDDPQGITMYFEAIQVSPCPIENSVFTVPVGYNVVSSNEFKKVK
jgi:hypothetical protein